ncbi:MAG: hypothetical protein BWX80_03254 [Candidatus Hydrogenedentes bacterium ADurb.Bin101]|nr:MAG: hypothetical protein BWX80_03254 [Candidatus Hydrogenedentes bacterium ADurb.Bin101]
MAGIGKLGVTVARQLRVGGHGVYLNPGGVTLQLLCRGAKTGKIVEEFIQPALHKPALNIVQHPFEKPGILILGAVLAIPFKNIRQVFRGAETEFRNRHQLARLPILRVVIPNQNVHGRPLINVKVVKFLEGLAIGTHQAGRLAGGVYPAAVVNHHPARVEPTRKAA